MAEQKSFILDVRLSSKYASADHVSKVTQCIFKNYIRDLIEIYGIQFGLCQELI